MLNENRFLGTFEVTTHGLLLSSYGESLKITGITTLYERRERLCHPFFQQNKNNAKITELFPDPYTPNYDLRLPVNIIITMFAKLTVSNTPSYLK